MYELALHAPLGIETQVSGQAVHIDVSDDKDTLTKQVDAWQRDRNKKHAKADWQFTTADARIKLKRLYPTL